MELNCTSPFYSLVQGLLRSKVENDQTFYNELFEMNKLTLYVSCWLNLETTKLYALYCKMSRDTFSPGFYLGSGSFLLM